MHLSVDLNCYSVALSDEILKCPPAMVGDSLQKDENANEANDFDFVACQITSIAMCFVAVVDPATLQKVGRGEIKASRERSGHRFVDTMVY